MVPGSGQSLRMIPVDAIAICDFHPGVHGCPGDPLQIASRSPLRRGPSGYIAAILEPASEPAVFFCALGSLSRGLLPNFSAPYLSRLGSCLLSIRIMADIRVAIDRGGTFCDVIANIPDREPLTFKLLSEHPANFSEMPPRRRSEEYLRRQRARRSHKDRSSMVHA